MAVPGQTVSAELSEFTIKLSASEVTPGSTITATNNGANTRTDQEDRSSDGCSTDSGVESVGHPTA